MSETITYDFDAALQSEIISLMMWDHDFLKRTDGLIRAEYFEDDIERGYARLALDFFTKYGEAPSKAAWVQLIKDAYAAKPPMWRDDQKADVVNRLASSAGLVIRSRAFVMDRIAEFARQQEITAAMYASAAELTKTHDPERFERISERMVASFKVGLKEGDEDYDYFERIEERTQDRIDEAKGAKPKTGVSTGIPELDAVLLHGGWGREELSLFMGAAKAGKSFNLTSAAAAATMLGYNVLFVTCENSTKIQAMRIDAYISEIGMSEFLAMPTTVGSAVTAASHRGAGKLKIRSFPTGTMRPRDLEILIDEYKTKGITFDLVVIDYLDIMAPDHPCDSNIETSKHIYMRVRGIAQKEKFAALSATQTNREGAKAAVAHATHVAEDFNRIRLADLVISINRTEDERVNNKARLYLAAARNQRDGITLFVSLDLDKGRAVTSVDSVE